MSQESFKMNASRDKFYYNSDNMVFSTIPFMVTCKPNDEWVEAIENGFGVEFDHQDYSKGYVDVNIYCLKVGTSSTKKSYSPSQPITMPKQFVTNEGETVRIHAQETKKGDQYVRASFSDNITFHHFSEQLRYIFRTYFTESLPPLFDPRFVPDYFRCVDVDTGEIISFGFDVFKRSAEEEQSSIYVSSTKMPPNKRSTFLLRLDLGKALDDKGNPNFVKSETKEPVLKDHWKISEERFLVQKHTRVGDHDIFSGLNKTFPCRNIFVDSSIGTFVKNPHYFQADDSNVYALKKTKRRIVMNIFFVFPETPQTENITTPLWIPFGVSIEPDSPDRIVDHLEWNVYDSMFGVIDQDHFWKQIQQIVSQKESKTLLSKFGNTKVCYSKGGMMCFPPDSNYFDKYLPFGKDSFDLYFTLDPSNLIRHVFKMVRHPHLHPFLRLICDVVVENSFFFILEKMQQSLKTVSKSKRWDFYKVVIDGYRNLQNRKNFMIVWYCFNHTDTIQSYVATLLVMFAQISFIEEKMESERQANIIYRQLCQKEERDAPPKKKRHPRWSRKRQARKTLDVMEGKPIVNDVVETDSELSRILSIIDSPNEQSFSKVRDLPLSFSDSASLDFDSYGLMICFTCLGRKTAGEMSKTNTHLCNFCAPFVPSRLTK